MVGAATASAILWGSAPVGAIVCEPSEGHEEEAIRTGWPPDAPYEFMLIATIEEVHAIRGDRETWGELIDMRIDAVLRGDLPLATNELHNPGLGTYGWETFEVGGQYLIAASASTAETPGDVYTSGCAPNEEVTSTARFDELVSYSAAPVLADTASPVHSGRMAQLGWMLVVIAGVMVVLAKAPRDP